MPINLCPKPYISAKLPASLCVLLNSIVQEKTPAMLIYCCMRMGLLAVSGSLEYIVAEFCRFPLMESANFGLSSVSSCQIPETYINIIVCETPALISNWVKIS